MTSRFHRIARRREVAFARWRLSRDPRAWRWLMGWDALYHEAMMAGEGL